MMIDFLPEDLVICILSRLHVKSAIRFTCVCKSWYTLLSDPKFVYKNLLFSCDDANMNNPRLLIRYWDKTGPRRAFSFLSYDDKLNMPWTQTILQFPQENFYEVRYPKIVGSCWNGLICLLMHFSAFVLWNPVTNETKEVPLRCPFSLAFVVGFGFDSKTNDYKIVNIRLNFEDQRYEFEIYSLRKNSWKKLDETLTVTPYKPYHFPFANFFGKIIGASSCHWYEDNSMVLSLDLSSETFKTTPLPDDCIFGSPYYCNPAGIGTDFFALNESVALVNSRDAKAEGGKSIDIWVLLEVGVKESWTKFFTIETNFGLGRPLGFWNGELVLVSETSSGQLLVYDPIKREIKSCVQLGGKAVYIQFVIPYVANSHSSMILESIKNS